MIKGLKQIGKGAFSKVYLKNKRKVIIKTKDYTKRCYAYYIDIDNTLIPNTEDLGYNQDDLNDDFEYYVQTFYPKVKSLKQNLTPFEYGFYKELQKLNYKQYSDNPYYGLDILRNLFESLPNKYWRKKEMLQDILNALSNYDTDIKFEISPRNVAIKNKKLILLDCFYFQNQLEKARKGKL